MREFLIGLPILVRYLIAGGTSTAIDLGILYVLTEYAHWWYLASATAAFSIAVVVSFILQKFYTFAHREVSRTVLATQSASYLTLQFANVGINALLMYALVEWAGVWYFTAQVIAAAAIALESFFIYRFIIFHHTTPLQYRMTRILLHLRRHRAALTVALFISLLYGMHHLFMPRFLPDGMVYKPVTYESDHDAGGYYAPRANAFFSQNKMPLPSFLPVLNPIIVGGLGKALGSIERAFIVSDFLFPPLIFLAVYMLSCEVLRRRLPALLLSSVFIVSPLAFLLSPSVPILALQAPLYFSSFEYPKITFLFYAFALLFIFRALARGGRKNIILAGVFFGSLFYTYLFDWAYISVALFIMLIWFALQREWSSVKSCIGIFGIGALVSIPYWLNFAALRRLPHYQDIIFRIGGLEVGRGLRFSSVWKTYTWHLLWIVALAATAFKRVPRQAIFLISFLVAYFVVANVQVVLGFSPQPDHWYRETFLPVMLSFGAVGIWLWEQYAARRAPLCVFIFLALFFAHAFYWQYRLSREQAVQWSIPHAEADAYAWLNLHTDAGSVVGSMSEETNRAIVLFTHNALFLPSGGTTLISNNEIWKRLYTLAALWQLTPEQLNDFVQKKTYHLFQDYYRSRSLDSYFYAAPPSVIPKQELDTRTVSYADLPPLDIFTAPYPLDYLFVGPREESIARMPFVFARFPLVYDKASVRIYRLNYENGK